MSTFSCPLVEIRDIEPIPDADAIELAVVGDYRSVVRKGVYRAGDIAVYIPEGAVLPELLIEEMGLTGKLAGAKKNRVKAIKLRGCLSQGLLGGFAIRNVSADRWPNRHRQRRTYPRRRRRGASD